MFSGVVPVWWFWLVLALLFLSLWALRVLARRVRWQQEWIDSAVLLFNSAVKRTLDEQDLPQDLRDRAVSALVQSEEYLKARRR